MAIVQQIIEHHVTLGGESHSGWLPQGAATPQPTAMNEVVLNITIEFDGSGYNLCWASQDGALANDSWHQTLEAAEQAALETFGSRPEQWETPSETSIESERG